MECQREAGCLEDVINFQGHSLCPTFFSKVSGISYFTIIWVMSDLKSGIKRYDHGNKSRKQVDIKSVKFTAWMLVFLDNYGQNPPKDNIIVLPPFLYPSELYKIYKNESTLLFPSKSSFYSHMKK